ncbi:LOW QUALITY PROTEIN: hypothetical protein PHPALM_28683 [Phytophthora palmivora]|uniref:Transposase n=1 Tax=Phytophthora palmivora TaxID=4796 RepID=A0A2P4X9F8_9STRA|nr:LOW QUALITY PROTEIN: hypothetical protein PHPALM_28683 [Phytophthora palmivora]
MSTRELARISEQKENQVTCLQKLIERGCASSTLNIRRHEAQEAFSSTHHMSISESSVWRILHDCGYTRKVLERRAMHIKEKDVCSVPGRAQSY